MTHGSRSEVVGTLRVLGNPAGKPAKLVVEPLDMWASHRGDAECWRAVVRIVQAPVAEEDAPDGLVVAVVEVAIAAGLAAGPVTGEAMVLKCL
jgi:hypothetical protein